MSVQPQQTAPSFAVDIEAYFHRIGYAGSRSPTLETLSRIHGLHPAAIPFENLDPLAKHPVDLAPKTLESKLIIRRRGGYCYEHNGHLKRILSALGFSVTGLAARVLWMAAPDAPVRPRTHMALRVDLPEGPYLADAGFGGMTLTAPIRLDTDAPQSTPHGIFRFEPVGDELRLLAQLVDRWQPVYQLSLQPQLDADYEASNWFVSTHPSSQFTHNLIMARVGREARFNLLNTALAVRYFDGRVEKRQLTPDALLRSLVDDFGLTADTVTAHEAVLKKLATA